MYIYIDIVRLSGLLYISSSFFLLPVTSGLTDMAAVIDYINGLDCEGDRYVAIFLSDYIITGGPATDIQVLQDRLATLTGKGYKVS